jgi:hypothetical protein
VTLANGQHFLAVAVGILAMARWSRELPWFPAVVLDVGAMTIASILIHAGARLLLRLRRRPAEERDPLAAWHRR